MRPHNMLTLLFLAALLLMVLGNKTHSLFNRYKVNAAEVAINCAETANNRGASIDNIMDEQPLFFIPVYHKYF